MIRKSFAGRIGEAGALRRSSCKLVTQMCRRRAGRPGEDRRSQEDRRRSGRDARPGRGHPCGRRRRRRRRQAGKAFSSNWSTKFKKTDPDVGQVDQAQRRDLPGRSLPHAYRFRRPTRNSCRWSATRWTWSSESPTTRCWWPPGTTPPRRSRRLSTNRRPPPARKCRRWRSSWPSARSPSSPPRSPKTTSRRPCGSTTWPRMLKKAGDKDHVVITANPVSQGVRVRVELEEGLLKVLARWARLARCRRPAACRRMTMP